MIADGCSVLYVGTATFKGTSCTCPDPGDPSAPCDPNIYGPGKGWPQVGDTVPFHLCFKSPTSYLNCQNPDNTGAPLSGDEFQRGITFQKNASVIAQVTIHTDHPFWDSVLHDTPVHFDQLAARVVGMGPAGTAVTYPTVTLEMTKAVDYRQVKDALGNVLSWRYCAPPDTSVHAPVRRPDGVRRRERGRPRPAPTPARGFAITMTSQPTTRARRGTSTPTDFATSCDTIRRRGNRP